MLRDTMTADPAWEEWSTNNSALFFGMMPVRKAFRDTGGVLATHMKSQAMQNRLKGAMGCQAKLHFPTKATSRNELLAVETNGLPFS